MNRCGWRESKYICLFQHDMARILSLCPKAHRQIPSQVLFEPQLKIKIEILKNLIFDIYKMLKELQIYIIYNIMLIWVYFMYL